jgi:hypothetical protein
LVPIVLIFSFGIYDVLAGAAYQSSPCCHVLAQAEATLTAALTEFRDGDSTYYARLAECALSELTPLLARYAAEIAGASAVGKT